jgi:DNA polymerase-3 subunit delta'
LNFDQFFGLDEQLSRLRADFSGGRFVHAYLFTGPSGTGKRSVAEICARAVHCAGADKPCDECPACKRVISGTHPDHILVSAPGRSIGVDAVRELVRRISIRPFEGGRYTVVIDDAEKLTQQAQNALLKTLEAPPGGAVFFLLTTTPSQLLPTIVSRLRHERFHPVPVGEAARALAARGVPPDRAALAASAASGCVGRALEQLEDAGYWSLRERVMQSLSLLTGPWAVAEAAAKLAADRDGAPEALEVLEGLARDMIRAPYGLAPQQADFPRLQAPRVDGAALLAGVKAARQKLHANVSWQTVLEMMYFDSLRGTIPWQQ